MRPTLTGGHAFVDVDGNRAKSDDVEKAARHDEVLIKMPHSRVDEPTSRAIDPDNCRHILCAQRGSKEGASGWLR
jgi:hypothetical protein